MRQEVHRNQVLYNIISGPGLMPASRQIAVVESEQHFEVRIFFYR
jgi:hypothetical protein